MEKEKIIIDDTCHEIDLRRVNVIVNACFGEAIYPERIMIAAEDSLAHFDAMEEIDPFTAKFFKLVVPDFPYDVTKNKLKKCPSGFRHLVGLFSLSLDYLSKGIKFGWRYPESGLHPKYQGNLADALIIFSDPIFLRKFLESGTPLLEEEN